MRGVIIIFAFLVSGCASDAPADQWTKQGARYGDSAVDLHVCERWSRTADDVRDCMTGHGWKDVASEP